MIDRAAIVAQMILHMRREGRTVIGLAELLGVPVTTIRRLVDGDTRARFAEFAKIRAWVEAKVAVLPSKQAARPPAPAPAPQVRLATLAEAQEPPEPPRPSRGGALNMATLDRDIDVVRRRVSALERQFEYLRTLLQRSISNQRSP